MSGDTQRVDIVYNFYPDGQKGNTILSSEVNTRENLCSDVIIHEAPQAQDCLKNDYQMKINPNWRKS